MTDNLRSILAMLAASTAFVLNDALVKLALAELPSCEVVVLRGLLATIMLVTGVVVLGASRPIGILLEPLMLLRFGSAAAATVFIAFALRYLPLPIVNTVLQVTPLAVTAGASLVFGEKVGWRRWAAALTGFFGVLLIVKPGGGYGAAVYLILSALIFTIVRDLSTRGLHAAIPSVFVAAASAVAITLAGLVAAPFDDAWRAPSVAAWAQLIVAAACLFIGNTLIIVALRTGEIAVVAPFRYVPVPLSLALGYWWWGDMPDAVAFIGIGLVLAAGLYTLHQERARLTLAPAGERSSPT